MAKRENKKRVNIYLNVEKYKKLKILLKLLNMTLTDFLDMVVTDFIKNVDGVLAQRDKDAFLELMNVNVEQLQEQIKKEMND